MGTTKYIYSINNNILYVYTIYIRRSIHDMDRNKELLVGACSHTSIKVASFSLDMSSWHAVMTVSKC